MMKKMMRPAVMCFSLGLLFACSGQQQPQNESEPTLEQAAAVSHQQIVPTEFKQTYSAEFNNRHYDIRLKRMSAKDQPKVVDEFGTEFYDNCVEVNISCDGTEFFDQSFTKSTFQTYLKDSERKETILLGMAYDAIHSNAQRLCLGAQIGLVGVEEGPAFRISISLKDGSVTIERDFEQDTTGNAGSDE